MTLTDSHLVDFDNSFARDLPGLYLDWKPAEWPRPELVALNRELAEELGLDPRRFESPESAETLAELIVGHKVPQGATPIAMAYAGHQFGGYSPRLGDGRALLLGELIDRDGKRRDLHLKGSGRTPFARGGDGKAALGPMLREFLVAEAMHALGIPTTRALAVVATGEQIARDSMVPGAVLARVAASHLRVGTFEYAARHQDRTLLGKLADYAIDRHYPQLNDAQDRHLAFLEAVIDAQASLIARWMLVGFIHGVMNTDNMAISGEGIDYGPCAFMDRFDPATVFSSIDHAGRYAYANQPPIAQWNLARLAETLIPLIDPDSDAAIARALERLQTFPDRYRAYWVEGMRRKLGLNTAVDTDGELFDRLLADFESQRADYTTAFRALARFLRGERGAEAAAGVSDVWNASWTARLDQEGRDRAVVADEMDRVNPIYIPRNHGVDHVLRAAEAGDLGPFRELLGVVTRPFDERDGLAAFADPAPDQFDQTFKTFCGT